jgi:hypothetical protein
MWMQTECGEGYKVRGLREDRDAGWRITTWPEGKDQPENEHLVKDGVFYQALPGISTSPTEWQEASFGDVNRAVDPAEVKAVLALIEKWDLQISLLPSVREEV